MAAEQNSGVDGIGVRERILDVTKSEWRDRNERLTAPGKNLVDWRLLLGTCYQLSGRALAPGFSAFRLTTT
jgi:hypothetical protein